MFSKFFLASSLTLVAGIASANFVVNSSFETPDTNGGWGQFPTDQVGGWFAEQDSMEVGAGSIYGVSGYTGNQVLELDSDGNAKISQNFSTLPTSYTITVDAALRSGTDASTASLDILWNDVVVGSILPTSNVLTTYSFTVTGTGTMDKLSLLGTGTSDSYGAVVDNVNLNLNAAPVPEPASMAVIGIGIAGLLRRRRK
jgi:PEP-CTERM motif